MVVVMLHTILCLGKVTCLKKLDVYLNQNVQRILGSRGDDHKGTNLKTVL